MADEFTAFTNQIVLTWTHYWRMNFRADFIILVIGGIMSVFHAGSFSKNLDKVELDYRSACFDLHFCAGARDIRNRLQEYRT